MKVYDSLEAMDYIASHTSLSRQQIAQVLEARVRFDIIRGLVPRPESVWDLEESIECHRARNADLLVHDPDLLDWGLELQYFVRNTSLAEEDILWVMAEEIGYLVSIGTLKPKVIEQFKAWADGDGD